MQLISRLAVNQLLEKNVIEDPSCACHSFNLVVKGALDPGKAKVLQYSTRDLHSVFVP